MTHGFCHATCGVWASVFDLLYQPHVDEAGTCVTMSDKVVTHGRQEAACVRCLLQSFYVSQDDAVPSVWASNRKPNRLLDGGIGRQMFGPRCVVVLLPVVPPSDWFWCDQVKISEDVPFKAARPPLSCPFVAAPQVCACSVAAPHTQPGVLPLFGLSFMTAPPP